MSVRWSRITPRALLGLIAALSFAAPALAQEVTVLCNFEVDWCEALKAAYEKTTGQKAVFIRRTDGESLAQIRAEKANPRADVYHAAESASAKQLAAEGLLEAYKSPRIADLHDWAQRIAEENQYFQTPIYTGVLGYGYNTELLAKKKLPEPKCWKDLANPAYKDEIQMANPGLVGHGIQHGVDDPADDGRGRGVQVPRGDEQERQPVHALGQRRHPGGCEGRDDDRHHIPARLGRADGAGLSGEDRRAVRRHRLRDHLVGDHQERTQSGRRAQVDGLRAVAGGTERRGDGQQVPDAVEQERPGTPDGAEAVRGQADQAGSRQVRLEAGPRAAALPLGERGIQGTEVTALGPRETAPLTMQRPGVAGWLAVGWFGFLFLPWNAIGGQGFLAFNWVAAYPLDARVAPAAVQLVYQGRRGCCRWRQRSCCRCSRYAAR